MNSFLIFQQHVHGIQKIKNGRYICGCGKDIGTNNLLVWVHDEYEARGFLADPEVYNLKLCSCTAINSPKYKLREEVLFFLRGKMIKGIIENIDRGFKEWEGQVFKNDGLLTLESTISSIVLPHSFDGSTLEVNYEQCVGINDKTIISKFYGFYYTVNYGGNRILLSERHLKRSKEKNLSRAAR
jgi:hypothetical protein